MKITCGMVSEYFNHLWGIRTTDTARKISKEPTNEMRPRVVRGTPGREKPLQCMNMPREILPRVSVVIIMKTGWNGCCHGTEQTIEHRVTDSRTRPTTSAWSRGIPVVAAIPLAKAGSRDEAERGPSPPSSTTSPVPRKKPKVLTHTWHASRARNWTFARVCVSSLLP